MHIGVLTHNYPRFAGDFSGTFVEALCVEYAAQGHDVSVWAPYDAAFSRPLDGSDLREPARGRVKLHLYRYAWPDRLHRLGYMRSMRSDLALQLESYLLSPPFFASGMATVLRQAGQRRPDVLHAHWLLPNGFIAVPASRRLQIPLVVSVPGSDAQVAGKNALFRSLARTAFSQADLLTANSESLRDAIVDLGADPRKFDMIIYGTDPEQLRPSDEGVQRLRAASRIADDALVLLCVGRMVHKKGFDVLLRAMARPALRQRPMVAVLVGEGDQLAQWRKLGDELGISRQLRWIGTVPKSEIGVYYNMADVLLMPSVSRPADGLNVCVLDAMSCAKAVIGSNVAGNPLAIVEGETGLLVPEQDPEALAAAIVKLADDPALRIEMGLNGRRRIEEELGWPHLARRYIRHFERLVANHQGNG